MAAYSVVILADTLQQVSALRQRGLDLHERAARRRPDDGEYAVPALLTDDQIDQLRVDGYRVTAQIDMAQVAVQRSAEVDPTVNRLVSDPVDRARFEDPRSAPQGDEGDAEGVLDRLMDLADVSLPAAGRAAAGERAVLGGYLTVDEVESALQTLAATYPGIATVSPLPESTWDGRTSHVVQLHAGNRPAPTGVLITGGTHAREWGGSDICVAFASNLLRSYRSGRQLRYGNKSFGAAEVRAIVENLDIFVFPDVNPDGKAYSQSNDPGDPQNLWWRKNRRRAGLPPGAEGVDINRNFDFLWSSGIGTTTDASQFTYRGPAPFSEPETRNLAWLFDTHPHIGYFVDVHSFGELILYSWGDDENQTDLPAQNFLNPDFDGRRGVVGDTVYREYISRDDHAVVTGLAAGMGTALTAVRGEHYSVDQAVGLYPTSATSDDYAFSRHRVNPARRKVCGFTIEFGQEFVPPYHQMRGIMADVAAALTELCRHAASAP